MTISISKEHADFLMKSNNEMKAVLSIKSRHDDPIYSLLNLVHQESLHPLDGAQLKIIIPEIKTSRIVGSYFTPYWIRLDIYNSGIDRGDISRLTCFPKGQSKKFAVLDQELMPSDIWRGEIFKNFKTDIECVVNMKVEK